MPIHLCPSPACAATHVAEQRRSEAMLRGPIFWAEPSDYQPRHLREEADVD